LSYGSYYAEPLITSGTVFRGQVQRTISLSLRIIQAEMTVLPQMQYSPTSGIGTSLQPDYENFFFE
jgi:hypothetical protein